MDKNPTYGRMDVRDPRVEAKLAEIGGVLKDAVSTIPGYGFALLIFEFGEGGNMFYASNAERDDVLEAMQEFIDKHQ